MINPYIDVNGDGFACAWNKKTVGTADKDVNGVPNTCPKKNIINKKGSKLKGNFVRNNDIDLSYLFNFVSSGKREYVGWSTVKYLSIS